MEQMISVVIPTYNRAATIKQAIDTVLNQTYVNIEVIVVDDCSSDNTSQIVSAIDDSRVRFVRLPVHSGANIARNEGIRRSRGEYIAFQDSDDEWLPNKLEIQIRQMKKEKREVCFCAYILKEDTFEHVIPESYVKKELLENGAKEILKVRNIIGTPTLVIRKNIVDEVGVFDEEMKRFQDYEYVIRIAKRVDFCYVNIPLAIVYRTKNSISSNNASLIDSYLKIIEKHMDFINFEEMMKEAIDSSVFDFQEKYIDKILELIERYRNNISTHYSEGELLRHLYRKYSYVMESLIQAYSLLKEQLQDKQFIIYGAGNIGKRVYREMRSQGLIPHSFWVTNLGDELEIDGIPVHCMTECKKKELPVIVAVSHEKKSAVIENLLKHGIGSIFLYPYT